MWQVWKPDIIRAIVLVVIVATISLVVNRIRTPLFDSMAASGRISKARARSLAGVNLIDDWSHKGWPEVLQDAPPGTVPDPGNGNGVPIDGNERPARVVPIDVYEAKEYYDSGDCVFFDAREPEYYAEGHIAGALNWPSDRFDAHYFDFIDQIEPDDCIIVYCIGGACDESYHLAISLLAEGFGNVLLYEGGMEVWEYSGFPTSEGPEP